LLASKSEHGPLARWIHDRGQSPYEAVLASDGGDPTMLDPELLNWRAPQVRLNAVCFIEKKIEKRCLKK